MTDGPDLYGLSIEVESVGLTDEGEELFDAIIRRVARRGEGITLADLAKANGLARALSGGADSDSPRVAEYRRELGI